MARNSLVICLIIVMKYQPFNSRSGAGIHKKSSALYNNEIKMSLETWFHKVKDVAKDHDNTGWFPRHRSQRVRNKKMFFPTNTCGSK